MIKKISIVMPVYNMQNYLKEAIESFLAQSIEEKELICVDDCSTDNSRDIIREYISNHSNINLYEMDENVGVGEVRRRAMELVTGEYIGFLDADDKYWRDDALKILYLNATLYNCEVCGGLLASFDKEKRIEYSRFRDQFNEKNSKEFKYVSYENFQDDYYFQAFIYKREFIESNHIEFPPFRRNEDPPFMVKALYKAEKLGVVNVEYYAYRTGHKEVIYTPKSVIDLLDGFIFDLEFASSNGLYALYDKTIRRLNNDYLECLADGVSSDNLTFLKRLLYTSELIEDKGYSLDIWDYLEYLQKHGKCTGDFKVYQKCKRILRDNSSIVIFGAGEIGNKVYKCIIQNSFCNVLCWVDTYKSGQVVQNTIIKNPMDILNVDENTYEFILIAIDKKGVSDTIFKELKAIGINENKIVKWHELER